jgi:CheY-specific phosphatase CheX
VSFDRPPDARPIGPDDSPEVVEAFTAAVITTFEELVQCEVMQSEPFMTRTAPAAGEVSAAIALRRVVPGRVILALSSHALKALATRYLPAETLLTHEILEDLAGEFLNVITGQAKTMLKGTRFHFYLSPPIMGSAADEHWPMACEILVLPFSTEAGLLALNIQLPPCDE